MSERIAAIVPMRHDSERVVGKNYRDLGGRPLYHHIVRSLLDVPEVSTVVIDTDSPTILKDAARSFPEVRLLMRPEHLRDGSTPMNDVLANTIGQIEADLYLQTHSTNPFLATSTISLAIRTLVENPDRDSLFGTTRFQARFWSRTGVPLNHDPGVLMRTQDLEPLFLENSCIYLFSKNVFEARANRIGLKPIMFEIPPSESLDIDEETDFEFAQIISAGRSV